MTARVHMRPRQNKPATTEAAPTSDKKPTIAVVESTPVQLAAPAEEPTAELVTPATAPADQSGESQTEGQDADEEEEDDDDVDLSLLTPDAPTSKAKKVEEEQDEQGFLQIHSEKCLSCKALVPTAEKQQRECHWKKGNQNCPAQHVQIVVRIPLEQIVPKFVASIKEGNYERLAKLSAVLASKPDWYQQRVKQAIAEAQARDAE